MKTVVLKFGGTSVGSIERIKKVANIIGSYRKKNIGVIVVKSRNISFLSFKLILGFIFFIRKKDINKKGIRRLICLTKKIKG